MSSSHLARCLVHTGGTKQMFAESDPKSLPALVFFADFDPREPHPAVACPASCTSRQRRAGGGPMTVTALRCSLVPRSAPSVSREDRPRSGKRAVCSFPPSHTDDSGHPPELSRHAEIFKQGSSLRCSYQVHTAAMCQLPIACDFVSQSGRYKPCYFTAETGTLGGKVAC